MCRSAARKFSLILRNRSPASCCTRHLRGMWHIAGCVRTPRVRCFTMRAQIGLIAPATAARFPWQMEQFCKVRLHAHCHESCLKNEEPTSSRSESLRVDVASDDSASLEGINEFDRESAGFLREVLRASPISCLARVPRLRQKASDFIDDILLGSV